MDSEVSTTKDSPELEDQAAAAAEPAPGTAPQYEVPAKERLTLEDVAAGDLLALTHLHRYELAGALLSGRRVIDLCCGVGYGSRVMAEAGAAAVRGVDVDPEAVREATEGVGADERLSFVCDDATRFVERLGAGEADAVVCFEGIEHVPDPVALADALGRLVRDGVRVIVSLPNSKGYHEDNEHHTTEFGWEEASELLAGIGEHELLTQHLAEGSVMLAPRDAESGEIETPSTVVVTGTSAPWANHWIAAFNFPADELASAAASFRLTSVPNNGSYMNALERSNADLHAANQRMARHWLGLHDTAAAAVVHRLEAHYGVSARELERLRQRERDADEYQARLRRADHRAVDRLAMTLKGLPGLRRLASRRRSSD